MMFQAQRTAYAKVGGKKELSDGFAARAEWEWVQGGQGGLTRRLGSRGRQGQAMTRCGPAGAMRTRDV